MKNSIVDIHVNGKRVLARLDLNVPLDDHGNITDDRRIRAALPTICYLNENGAMLILMSHLGRPAKEGDRRSHSLRPVAARLSELLGKPVPLVETYAGAGKASPPALVGGDVVLLENLRFHNAETIKDKDADNNPAIADDKRAFAQALADMADVYVNDAFGTCHRDNASMVTVPALMQDKPRVVGFLVQRELAFLGAALTEPPRPFVCVLGGAKVSDKLGVIEALLDKCDRIVIGGAMAYTFLAARGTMVGNSLVEQELIATASELLKGPAGDRIMLPSDSVVADRIAKDARVNVVGGDFPDGLMGLDIGPATRSAFRDMILLAKTIVWNGPMGVFETPPFDQGTVAVAQAVADATDAGATSIIGGGDSAAAVELAGVADRISHISTGGGASLEFLEGRSFPAIEMLDDK